MQSIRFQGRAFPLVESFTFAEIDFVERQTKQPLDEWTSTTATRATIFLSIRRGDPQLLTWQALGNLGIDDVSIEGDDDDQGAEADQESEATDGDRPTEPAEAVSENEGGDEARNPEGS